MLLTAFFAALFLVPTTCLLLTSVVVPTHKVVGESVVLGCQFDTQNDKLHSVMWFLDNKEFYRYVSNAVQRGTVFRAPGIDVDVATSTDRKVVLRSVTLDTSGIFKCEVSVNYPNLHTVSKSAPMIVVDLPDGTPVITGGQRKYNVGDDVSVQCMSQRSRPAASLTWFINGRAAPPNFLTTYPPEQLEDRLETASLGLSFTVRSTHLATGTLRLKCTATIGPVYSQSSEVAAEGILPQTTPAPTTRAPRKKAVKSGTSIVAQPLLLLLLALLLALLYL